MRPDKLTPKGIRRFDDIPTPKPIPPSIEGWLWSPEVLWLYHEADITRRHGVQGGCLEVGSYKGLSASAIGQAGPLTCVDTFRGGNDLPETDTRDEFNQNMELMGLKPRVIVGDSKSVLQNLVQWEEEYRFIFIDGGHDFATVSSDIANAKLLLSEGGSIALDDISPGFQDIIKACEMSGLTFRPIAMGGCKVGVARK